MRKQTRFKNALTLKCEQHVFSEWKNCENVFFNNFEGLFFHVVLIMCAFDCFGKLCFSIKHFGKEALAMLVFGARCFFFLVLVA